MAAAMSTIDDARILINQLSRPEKARLLALLAGDPSVQFAGIAISPGVCGGAPRVAGTRIPVWLLEGFRRDGMSKEQLLAAYPQLTQQQLADAQAFADQNRELIDEEI